MLKNSGFSESELPELRSHAGWVANGNPTQIRILSSITFFVFVGLTCANPTYGLLKVAKHKQII
jgi:hypothetical protein